MDSWLFLKEQEILEEIGKGLKKIRLQHNLTQKEMSEEVGLKQIKISIEDINPVERLTCKRLGRLQVLTIRFKQQVVVKPCLGS